MPPKYSMRFRAVLRILSDRVIRVNCDNNRNSIVRLTEASPFPPFLLRSFRMRQSSVMIKAPGVIFDFY